ncbi:MAG TPA: MFS transporter [Solirubrobacteraceae bacterium]|jgi:MFS family permease|nr:MFS transporter [Solirubrobacteraceae bacterium]
MSWIMCLLRSRLKAAKYSRQDPARGTVVLVRVLLLFESAMYSAITPVLPHYADVLHASKPAVGVLAGAYPAGIIPGSLIGAWIATRAGVRRTTLIGLLLFAVSIAGFGFGTSIATLDVLRFFQGAGCGFIWGGGLTWVITVAPRERRGAMLGSVIGAAIFGTLIGPVLGILAVTVGTGPVFAVVGASAIALAAWTQGHPNPVRHTSAPETDSPLRDLARSPLIRLGSWLILLEAATIGATSALLPLRLARFGAHSIVVGAVFLVASLMSMAVSGPIGRTVDRRGAGVPLCVGLTLTAILMALLPLPHSAALLAVVSVVALGGPLTAYTIPALTVITDTADRLGIPLVVATMMLNLAWAFGEVIGAPAAANLSQATSDAVPLLALSAIMVVTLRPVIKARLTTAQPHGADDAEAAREAWVQTAAVR